MILTKHLDLFASDGFICFKLPWEAAMSYLVYASQHWSPAIGLSLRRSRWLWCELSNHIPFSLPLFKQLINCTVETGCNFPMYYHLWEWDLLINIPFDRQYSTIYLYVLFFLCQSVHLIFIVHIQMIWTLCFRMCCLFCTWWLICTPSPIPPSIRIVVILFYDDVDISNEGKCFNATSVISTLMQHIDKCFLPIV